MKFWVFTKFQKTKLPFVNLNERLYDKINATYFGSWFSK